MKILLLSLGTRGDCEPFLGVAEMLRTRGETVICGFSEQYRNLAEDNGFAFRSLGTGFIDLLESDDGKTAMGGSAGGVSKIAATLRIAMKSMPAQIEALECQKHIVDEIDPDIIIFHPKISYALPWGLKTGKQVVELATIPRMIHEVRGTSPAGINKNLGVFNHLAYKVVLFGHADASMMAVKRYFKGAFSKGQISRELLRIKTFTTVSPSLFSRPDYWPQNAIVAGFWERDKTVCWQPPEELTAFLGRHERILFITFGSMTDSKPQKKTKLFLDVLKDCGIPAIINISGGGLMQPEIYDKDNVLFLESVPYDWLFPKIYATVHHGGAGTVHSSLKAGCATMAIPHAVDQPMWNEIIEKSGAGPRGIPATKLKHKTLQPKLLDLWSNPSYKVRAREIAARMADEDFGNELYNFIVGKTPG